jgi:hypothetical protein
VEIEIRDANGFDGLGQDQCRQWQRISGVNTFRLVLAATRTLWFIQQVESSAPVNLRRYRPWYRQKVAPSQRDVVWACREAWQVAGVFPTESAQHGSRVLSLAACGDFSSIYYLYLKYRYASGGSGGIAA